MPIEKVRVMISSRCKHYATVDGSKFGLELPRKTLKAQIESEEVFGQNLIQCFTSESEPAKAARTGGRTGDQRIDVHVQHED
jgi:hypothetical protein